VPRTAVSEPGALSMDMGASLVDVDTPMA
jgi:hypothetical protein